MKKTFIYLVVHAEDILFAAQSEEIAKRLIHKECRKNTDEEDEYQIDKMEMVIDLSAENKYKKIIQSEITRCHEMILATHKFFRDSLFRPEVVDRDFGKEIREKRIRNAKKIMKKYIANLRQLRYIENTAV